jgi:hypothetical protein
MKKIKELQKRSSLNEGRNFGIGFAVLKPINSTKNKFETLNAFTACRDYLNDFSYVEYTKKEIGSVYGYNHKLLNVFNNKRLFYLGINTLDYKGGGSWNLKEEALNILIANYKNLERLLNKFEEKLGLKTKSSIRLDEDVLIIKAPIYWTKTTALISVYTLIIRCFFNIENFNDDNFEEILRKHKPFIMGDSMMIKNCIKFYDNSQLDYDKINYDNHNILSATTIHNFGIDNYFKLSAIKSQLNE